MKRPSAWSYRVYPELNRFSSEAEAVAVLDTWKDRLLKTPIFWAGLVLTLGTIWLVIAAILPTLSAYFNVSLGGWFMWIVVYNIVVPWAVAVLVLTRFWRRRCRRFLREQLVAQGIAVCVACGYDVRAQTTPRCPECGSDFDASMIEMAKPWP